MQSKNGLARWQTQRIRRTAMTDRTRGHTTAHGGMGSLAASARKILILLAKPTFYNSIMFITRTLMCNFTCMEHTRSGIHVHLHRP